MNLNYVRTCCSMAAIFASSGPPDQDFVFVLHIFLYQHICLNIFANVFFRLVDRWGQDDRQPVRAGGRDDLPGEPLIRALIAFKVKINLSLLTYKTSIQINMTDNLSVRMQHASMGFKNARWDILDKIFSGFLFHF